MIEKLNSLIEEWEKEASYLCNPWDDERDRYAGQTYKECASRLKEIVVACDGGRYAEKDANGYEKSSI